MSINITVFRAKVAKKYHNFLFLFISYRKIRVANLRDLYRRYNMNFFVEQIILYDTDLTLTLTDINYYYYYVTYDAALNNVQVYIIDTHDIL